MSADGSPIIPPEVTAELKKMTEEARNAISAITEVKADNAETKRNIENWFKTYEEHNAAHARRYAEYQKAISDQKEALEATEKKAKESADQASKRIDDLVMTIATKGGAKTNDGRDAPEYKAVFEYLKKGSKPANASDSFAFRPDLPAEFKTLRTDNVSQGGYLIPQVMDNEIRKNMTEISPVRLFARVRVAPGKTMDIPRRLALLNAYYEGEGESAPSDQSTYGSEQITLYRQTVKVPATLDMMVSSAFDLEREIAADVGESFGKNEGYNFVQGVGAKGPQGFVQDSRCEVIPTASSGTITFSDLANVMGKLKRGQSPWWFMNRRTLSYVQQISSTIGVPIWQPVAGNTPATIWGFPYNSDMIDLDDAQTGSNAKPIVFGDLRRGYEIYDMLGISVIRDDLTKADMAITQWIFRRYNTGRVIMPEAIKICKVL